MKALAAAVLSATAAMTFFVVMRSETPWFAPKSADLFSTASSASSIAPGQTLLLTTVPANRRLVVTSLYASDASWGMEQYLELLQQDSAGTVVTKLPVGMPQRLSGGNFSGAPHGVGEGVVFDGGTDVVFRLDPGAPFSTSKLAYFVGGYFTTK